MSRFFSGLLVLVCASLVYADPPETAQLPTTLIYCDESPGTIAYADLWQRVAVSNNQLYVLTTTVEGLTTRLNQGPWKHVIIIARHQQGDPQFAPVVREYCNANPDKLAQLFIWHDNGQTLPANKAVIGTTASLIWSRGVTTIGYAIVGVGSAENAAQAVTTPGLILPCFSGIQTVAQLEIGEFSIENQNGVEAIGIVYVACRLACTVKWVTDIDTCNTNHAAHVADCNALYGPTDLNNPNEIQDPVALNDCLNQATQDLVNCRNGATNRWKLCEKKCSAQEAPVQPTPVNPE